MSRQVWSIINATPDSFFADSRAKNAEHIVQMALDAVSHGAHVIDLGGMSTRPGHADVPEEEELRRLCDAFASIRSVLPNVVISVDTFRSRVVEKLYDKFGRFIVNDISGGQADPLMLSVVGRMELSYVMMSQAATMDDILLFFDENIHKAEKLGVKEIIIDPGFGFGKEMIENFRILRRLPELKKFGKSVLCGISRKRMVWQTLGTTPDKALNGTTALHFELLGKGADILRVHDTKEAIETIKLYETYFNFNR